eukprot:Nitzschia sp. Nitz4//scaffold17_size182527//137924//140248//NITZ4_001875-RA/size182527-snap-gene-0.283-mRNA-1//1//CDS//3329539403//6300//frame0
MSNDKDKPDKDENGSKVTKEEQEHDEPMTDSHTDNNDNNDNNNDPQAQQQEEPQQEQPSKQEQEELRKKYANWPLRGIKEPHDNDVMYGRGGGTNHHPGNKRYRKMVEDRKLEYVNSKRLDKPLVALEIIRVWRAQLPPGRFLKLDEKTGLWHDVGDKKAREKTSQALREKAPLLRKQQEEDGSATPDMDNASPEPKSTRFAEGTKTEDANGVTKVVLARDHSLGREYIEDGGAVTLDGFSWQDPFQSKPRDTSFGRLPPPGTAAAAAAPPNNYPPGRISSHGSIGMAPPHHATISSGGPPPPPDFWNRVPSIGGDRQREYSNGRIESWGNGSFGYAPPPPPPPPGHAMHQRSGSWAHGPPPPPGRATHQRSGSWGSGREHSLGMIPLIGASVSAVADRSTFDSGRMSSGYWGEVVGGSPARAGGPVPPPPPPPAAYGPPIRSNGSLGPYRQAASPTASTPSPKPATATSPYNVDPSIARTWSGGDPGPWPENPGPALPSPYEGLAQPTLGSGPSNSNTHGPLPRPQMVKRDTSHQNEQPQVKRAALNRDNSLASNRLKQEYMPQAYPQKFDEDQEMRSLSSNLEQSRLADSNGSGNGNSSTTASASDRPKPKPLDETSRVSTLDAITMDLMARPVPILKSDRVSTIDALDLDLEGDSLINNADGDKDAHPPEVKELPRPKSLESDDRLSTKDFMNLVNSPISEVDANAETEGDEPLALNQEKIADEWLTQV